MAYKYTQIRARRLWEAGGQLEAFAIFIISSKATEYYIQALCTILGI